MGPVEALREFINVRLSAAAGEIYSEFQQTINKYQQEIDTPRDVAPKASTADVQKAQLCKKQTRPTLSKNEPGPSGIEQEPSQQEVDWDSDVIMVTVMDEMGDAGGKADSHNSVREFINRRLTAAAGEIFSECQQSIVLCQEDIDTHNGLVDISLKPQKESETIDVPEHSVCEEEQLWNQEMKSTLEQELQIKEEQEELCASQEVDKLMVDQYVSHFMMLPTVEPNQSTTLLLPQHSNVNSGLRRIAPKDPNNPKSSPRQRSFSFQEKSWENTFQCDTCSLAFRHHSSLSRHKRIHHPKTTRKAYVKSLDQSSNLVVHISSLTDEKPYSCGMCEETFSCWNSMTSHIQCHTGVKMFPCETCGRSFRHLSSLYRHKRTHN